VAPWQCVARAKPWGRVETREYCRTKAGRVALKKKEKKEEEKKNSYWAALRQFPVPDSGEVTADGSARQETGSPGIGLRPWCCAGKGQGRGAAGVCQSARVPGWKGGRAT